MNHNKTIFAPIFIKFITFLKTLQIWNKKLVNNM